MFKPTHERRSFSDTSILSLIYLHMHPPDCPQVVSYAAPSGTLPYKVRSSLSSFKPSLKTRQSVIAQVCTLVCLGVCVNVMHARLCAVVFKVVSCLSRSVISFIFLSVITPITCLYVLVFKYRPCAQTGKWHQKKPSIITYIAASLTRNLVK